MNLKPQLTLQDLKKLIDITIKEEPEKADYAVVVMVPENFNLVPVVGMQEGTGCDIRKWILRGYYKGE